MNRLKLLLLLPLLLCLSAMGQPGQIQQIKIVSFTVKNQLPSIIDNWNGIPGALLLVAQKPPTIRVEGVRLVIQIRSNGAMICGSNASNGLPVDNFTTRTFNVNELTGLLAGCHELKDGSYSICAQFFNIDKVAISNEVCKEFTVETPKETEYSPPTLITPDNGKEYSATDMLKPVMFRWTPLVPKPSAPVTYRLKVWQLMEGQSGTMAMRTNQPIVTKDVDNLTQAVVNNIYTGPCRPPYLCDYIWSVQALNREGKPMGRNNGTSEPYTFSVKENEIHPTIKNLYPEDKKKFTPDQVKTAIAFRWTALVPKPSEPVSYRLKVWQLMQGQSSSQAMRTNQPIVVKDVDNITEVSVSGIYTGPCRPPYLCDYVWMVEARIKNAPAPSEPIASSSPSAFTINIGVESTDDTSIIEASKIVNSSPENNTSISVELFFDGFEEKTDTKKPLIFKWTAAKPQQQGTVTYRLRVWQLMQGQSGSQAMRTNQPIVTKDVDNITQVAASGIYTGPCRPPYLCDFIWNVEASIRQAGATPKTIATSEPTTFKITEAAAETGSFKLVAPENGKKFLPNEMAAPVLFKWTALVPKPSAAVIYRLKVWQLMQGQNSTEAMKTNQPIVTKDVDNITQASVNGIWTGPCRPPYLCDYVWQVQALNRAGQPMGSNEGKSEVWSFKVQNNIDIEIDSVFVSCCDKGMQNIYIRVKNNLGNPVNIVSIKYKINGAGAAIVLTPVSPAVPTTTIPGNGTQVFTSKQKCITANFLKFLVDAEDVADPDNKETEVANDTLKCICNACDSMKIDIQKKDLKFDANGNIVLNTNISVSPKLVSSIKAELVYYEYKPDSDDCMLCNKDSKTFGNFSTGTHSQEWLFAPPKNLSGGTSAPMVITVPPTVKCCDAVIKFCIRYVITFSPDCTVCNKLVCYEIKKEGCAKGNPNPNDQK